MTGVTERVAVVGAGTMGAGIAQVVALAGHPTALCDVGAEQLDRAMAAVAGSLERQTGRGTIGLGEAREALARIEPTTRAERALPGADLVIEAVPEKLELKRRVFEQADEYTQQGAVLASNTSSISITSLGAATSRPESVVGMHFMNPVPVMKLVEIVRGLATSDETAARVTTLARKLGKTPVEVRDYPGFVSNRVLMPMINEAAFALLEGVADAEAIDEVMRLGMNHPMGPLALADLIGLDVCLDILRVLHDQLGEHRYRPCPLLRKYVEAGWLGRKTGRGFHTYADGGR